MGIVGVGLLLDESTTSRLIEFKKRWSHVLLGPPFGAPENAPHITLYQFPVDSTRIPPLPSRVPRERVTWGELSWQPVDWAFALTNLDPWLINAQRYVVGQLFDHVDRFQLEDEKKLIGYTSSERLQYLTMGYRYGGVAFKPHVTMGQLTVPLREEFLGAVRDFSNTFTGTTATCEKVILYQAGTRGSISRVLAAN